jgi:hypothetical protein
MDQTLTERGALTCIDILLAGLGRRNLSRTKVFAVMESPPARRLLAFSSKGTVEVLADDQ